MGTVKWALLLWLPVVASIEVTATCRVGDRRRADLSQCAQYDECVRGEKGSKPRWQAAKCHDGYAFSDYTGNCFKDEACATKTKCGLPFIRLSCAEILLCNDEGTYTRTNCPPGFRNEGARGCIYDKSCVPKQNESESPSNCTEGTVLPTANCRTFRECHEGKYHSRQCTWRGIWRAECAECDDGSPSFSQCKEFTTRPLNQSVPLGGRCSFFERCVGGRWRVEECGEGTGFDEAKGKCTRGRLLEEYCNPPVHGPRCREGTRIVVNVCRRFVECRSGQWLEMECPPGSHFDKGKNKCARGNCTEGRPDEGATYGRHSSSDEDSHGHHHHRHHHHGHSDEDPDEDFDFPPFPAHPVFTGFEVPPMPMPPRLNGFSGPLPPGSAPLLPTHTRVFPGGVPPQGGGEIPLGPSQDPQGLIPQDGEVPLDPVAPVAFPADGEVPVGPAPSLHFPTEGEVPVGPPSGPPAFPPPPPPPHHFPTDGEVPVGPPSGGPPAFPPPPPPPSHRPPADFDPHPIHRPPHYHPTPAPPSYPPSHKPSKPSYGGGHGPVHPPHRPVPAASSQAAKLHAGLVCDGDFQLADPFDCSWYYDCIQGYLQRKRCFQGTHFDPRSGVCSVEYRCSADEHICYDDQVMPVSNCGEYRICRSNDWLSGICPHDQAFINGRCDSSRTCSAVISALAPPPSPPSSYHDPRCTPGAVRPAPSNPIGYLECDWSGRWVKRTCDKGGVFDRRISRCVYAKPSDYSPAPSSYHPPCYDGQTRGEAGECSKYSVCVRGQWQPRYCAFGSGFHGIQCEEDYECGGGKQRPNGECRESAGKNGYLADRRDCAYFYQCAQGRWVRMPCAPGTHYNPQIGVCDHIGNVPGCGWTGPHRGY